MPGDLVPVGIVSTATTYHLLRIVTPIQCIFTCHLRFPGCCSPTLLRFVHFARLCLSSWLTECKPAYPLKPDSCRRGSNSVHYWCSYVLYSCGSSVLKSHVFFFICLQAAGEHRNKRRRRRKQAHRALRTGTSVRPVCTDLNRSWLDIMRADSILLGGSRFHDLARKVDRSQ